MAANFTDIEKALISAVLSVDSVTPTGMPNAILADKNKGDGLWLQLHNIRGASDAVTLGIEGEDNHSGILQIDINYPKNKGTAEVLSKADEFGSTFTVGKSLLYNAQYVKVLSCSLDPGREVQGYYRASLTVRYYARTQRI